MRVVFVTFGLNALGLGDGSRCGVDDRGQEGELRAGRDRCWSDDWFAAGYNGSRSGSRVRDGFFNDDCSRCGRRGFVVVIIVVVVEVAGHLVDERDYRIVRGLRAAHSWHKETLEADRLSQLVQL